MKTLELCFGKKRVILEKIVKSIKELPSMDSGKINLLQFSSKLKNAVQALESLKNVGYLYSPEFTEEVLSKIPKSMLQEYARYSKRIGNDIAQCLYCGYHGHEVESCKKFSSEMMRERWKIARKLKLCFNCLKADHGRKGCTLSNGCNQCNRNHHRLLHFTPRAEEPKQDGISDKNNSPNTSSQQNSNNSDSSKRAD